MAVMEQFESLLFVEGKVMLILLSITTTERFLLQLQTRPCQYSLQGL